MPHLDIDQLEFIDRNLRNIVLELEAGLGITFTITSLYRIGDTGVHGQLPLRGIDLRCHNEFIGYEVIAWVNSRWKYDPDRPQYYCAIYHGDAPHVHLQTHPKTQRVT